MRIEIMIDKEQKISQSTLDALESELYRNLRPLYPVSYTHLRAHETDSYLVCRLLLEKKNSTGPKRIHVSVMAMQ